MTTLVNTVLIFRRCVRSSYGFVAALVLALLLLSGAFQPERGPLGLEHAFVGLGWLAITAAKLRARRGASSLRGTFADAELGLLLLVAVHALLQWSGGLESQLYPAVYVAVALICTFARSGAAVAVVLGALGLEAGLWALLHGGIDWTIAGSHAAFLGCFGLLNLAFTRGEIVRVRVQAREDLARERQRVKDEARRYRLVAAPTESTPNNEEQLLQSSVEEVRQALYYTVDLLKRTLDLHTCVLVLVDESEARLQVVELATDSDEIAEEALPMTEGVLGAIASRGINMKLENLRPGYSGIGYYRSPSKVKSFLGVPILDRGKVRGALCADRVIERAFGEREEKVLEGAAVQILRFLENERLFVQLERSKREQASLHHASNALGAALTEEGVIDAALEAAREMVPHDFAAITAYDSSKKRHRLRKVLGRDAEKLDGLSFASGNSLVAMAIKNRHYLPYRGHFDPAHQVVFTKRNNLKGMRSLIILPLVVRDGAIGTLVLAAEREDAFRSQLRTTLQVLASHVAVALSNAASVKRLEQLATTDGLTGLLNKRTFMETMDQRLKAAERFGHTLSLIVTDIDHFKSVNDTYGHATGDVVIRGLGEVLQQNKRDTDAVARFGGEEFCILCEETDTPGAKSLAERIREDVGALTFTSEQGELSVTASLGVATFPFDADTSAALFEAADQALYDAKRGGRNQVRTTARPGGDPVATDAAARTRAKARQRRTGSNPQVAVDEAQSA